MITKNLRKIFLFSIPLFMLHGSEEYLTGFYKVDDILFGRLNPEISQMAFIVFQLSLWSLLILTGLKAFGTKWTNRLIVLAGVIYIFEAQHLIHAFIDKVYYPGSYTALIFPIFAVIFWREFIKNRGKYVRS